MDRPSLRERLSGSIRRGAKLLSVLRKPLVMGLRIAVVASVAAGAVALGRLVVRHARTAPTFAVRSITVEGEERLTEAEIVESAGLGLGQNVFDRSPEEVERRLSAHPWIADAHVRRRLPGAFDIEVREHRAVALLVLELETIYLVGEDGVVFKEVGDGDPIDLPAITGVERERFLSDRPYRASVLVEVVALLHDFRGAGLWRREPISEVHVEADGGLTLTTGEDGLSVRLGKGPFRGKLRRLRTVLDRLKREDARPQYVYLDNVRRPDRVTVRLP